MSRAEVLSGLLEQHNSFEDPYFSGLYWFADPEQAAPIINEITCGIYGIEVGIGSMPCRVTNIDPGIPWLLFEPDLEEFDYARNDIQKLWPPQETAPIRKPILAINSYATWSMITGAQTMVYCHFDYRD